jgi:hypothetical protein
VCEYAQSAEPIVNSVMAARNTRFVPNRSASQPDAGISMAIVSAYAMTTDCMRSGCSPSPAAIDGSAVLTIVESSICMKTPSATSQSSGLLIVRVGAGSACAGMAARLCDRGGTLSNAVRSLLALDPARSHRHPAPRPFVVPAKAGTQRLCSSRRRAGSPFSRGRRNNWERHQQ